MACTQQSDADSEVLKQELSQAQTDAAEAKQELKLQKIRTRQLIAAWQMRIDANEEKMDHLYKQRDTEMKSIVSSLLMFEAQLRREQNDLSNLLKEKDRVIFEQRKHIKLLQSENEALKKALHQHNIDFDLTGNDEDSQQNCGSNRKSRRPRSKSSIELGLPDADRLAEVFDKARATRAGRRKMIRSRSMVENRLPLVWEEEGEVTEGRDSDVTEVYKPNERPDSFNNSLSGRPVCERTSSESSAGSLSPDDYIAHDTDQLPLGIMGSVAATRVEGLLDRRKDSSESDRSVESCEDFRRLTLSPNQSDFDSSLRSLSCGDIGKTFDETAEDDVFQRGDLNPAGAHALDIQQDAENNTKRTYSQTKLDQAMCCSSLLTPGGASYRADTCSDENNGESGSGGFQSRSIIMYNL